MQRRGIRKKLWTHEWKAGIGIEVVETLHWIERMNEMGNKKRFHVYLDVQKVVQCEKFQQLRGTRDFFRQSIKT